MHAVGLSRRLRTAPIASAARHEPTDSQLLARCREGDESAWAALVGRYERLVYTVALRNGLSSEDAADVCQSTFVALLEAIDTVRDEHRLASWLMTVARRHAWRTYNRSGREFLVADPADLPRTGTEGSAGWDDLLAVHDALSQIGQPCRDLLVALYFEPSAPSYADIARRFGRSIGGIGPMRGRCLERMRTLMDDGGESGSGTGSDTGSGGPAGGTLR